MGFLQRILGRFRSVSKRITPYLECLMGINTGATKRIGWDIGQMFQ